MKFKRNSTRSAHPFIGFLNNSYIIAYLFKSKKIPWSENEILLLQKATLCKHYLTFSNGTIQNFPLLSSR